MNKITYGTQDILRRIHTQALAGLGIETQYLVTCLPATLCVVERECGEVPHSVERRIVCATGDHGLFQEECLK